MSKIENMAKARETASYRELYALNHYDTKETRKINGRKLWIFRYSLKDPYQDANGAMYDIKRERWVG